MSLENIDNALLRDIAAEMAKGPGPTKGYPLTEHVSPGGALSPLMERTERVALLSGPLLPLELVLIAAIGLAMAVGFEAAMKYRDALDARVKN